MGLNGKGYVVLSDSVTGKRVRAIEAPRALNDVAV